MNLCSDSLNSQTKPESELLWGALVGQREEKKKKEKKVEKYSWNLSIQATEKPGTASVKITKGCCHQTLPGTYDSAASHEGNRRPQICPRKQKTKNLGIWKNKTRRVIKPRTDSFWESWVGSLPKESELWHSTISTPKSPWEINCKMPRHFLWVPMEVAEAGPWHTP